MTATAARVAALRVMRAVRRGILADRALHREQAGLEPRERAWLQELVYGSLRLRGRLDQRIAGAVRRPLKEVEGDVLDVLRLGAYQLTEMGGVPAWAAVSESVELVKPRGRGAAGFVNGVLKAIARADPSEGFPDPSADPVAWLSSWGSHPRWLVERWVARFGIDGTRRLVDANNQRADLYIRPLRRSIDDALEALARASVRGERVAGTGSVRLPPGTAPEDALAATPAVVQDPAAGLVVDCVAPEAGDTVADLCAAPGGKALALADGPAARVVACDISERRTRRLAENARRVGGRGLAVVVADAREPPLKEADVVLVDAPCSGTGTLRRHPDARWRVAPGDIVALTRLQDAILAAAAGIVRTGGVLVYATCTLEPEENEDRVESFLERHPEFGPEPCTSVEPGFLDLNGRLRVLPQVHGFDGAFAARLRRRD